MTFQLYVWHEPAPISADAAEATVRRWLDDDIVLPPDAAVAELRAELLKRFPPGDSPSFWTVPPGGSESLLALRCAWTHAGEFGEAVRDLAADRGLVCYEPHSRILNPNAPAQRPDLTLTPLPAQPDPDTRPF